VYQVLLGYLEIKIHKPWGTIENGVGSSMILQIKHLMKSKLWALLIFTGVPHHALVGNYRQLVFQMTTDVVKGRAGSPTLLRIITMLILISLLVQQIG
jgi:hypothetical protein